MDAFSMGGLPRQVALMVVVGIVAGLGAVILDDMQTSIGSDTTAVNNSLTNGIAAAEEITDWLDIIALVIAATIILALVLGVLALVRG